MLRFTRFCACVALVAASFGASVAPASAAAPVLVKQCFISAPKLMSKNASGTQIDYIIYGKKNASQITFAVAYRNAAQHFLRTVTDYGTFAPGVEIQHHFDLYNDVTYAGKEVQSCVPTKVKWSDSTLWIAPSSHH
ncbi:MAG: hypothetical protein JO029_14380 [Candidatus Eremiobacteraeota bacterium]|nr:hypothetical protein [Candidatus Eremiobacteraeota bacterium]MBV8333309.1 hypothetical protein [Candidatus Eremiobacteraeota bacterium]MBV8435462.1 hypothetical protein [Candidatus Eremiobacteraeota bacterium]MBV8583857.1 hypothetical protein [Candidatus Eremiobacteraeota bacterium]MBV8720616.1 hypothetical protein [Candidatus Eremiobacteraeota bacterium]